MNIVSVVNAPKWFILTNKYTIILIHLFIVIDTMHTAIKHGFRIRRE